MNENKIIKKIPEKKEKDDVISNLVDALCTDNFNQIIDKYTNTEIDFQTVVLFIKLYMMAKKVTNDKGEIKQLLNFAIKDSYARSEIVKSFNDGTIIKTFYTLTESLNKKLT